MRVTSCILWNWNCVSNIAAKIAILAVKCNTFDLSDLSITVLICCTNANSRWHSKCFIIICGSKPPSHNSIKRSSYCFILWENVRIKHKRFFSHQINCQVMFWFCDYLIREWLFILSFWCLITMFMCFRGFSWSCNAWSIDSLSST